MPSDKDLKQAEYLLNRLLKRNRHLKKILGKQGTNAYRVYDRDIPEIPLSVDRYGAHALVYLYERPYEKDPQDELAWLSLMKEAVAAALDIELASVFHKVRRHLGPEEQYEKDSEHVRRELVQEAGLSFEVRLGQYLDTGLFMDHRPTRALVRAMSEGKSVLNLYCYTGSFSVYALAGGARQVHAVDLSNTYLAWAEDNLRLNNVLDERYTAERRDAAAVIAAARSAGKRYDLIILDPPTFSNSKGMEGFLDLNRHWPGLVSSCMDILEPAGTLVFSTNSRELAFSHEAIGCPVSVRDMSERTCPEDYSHKPHRCWFINHAASP